MIKKIEIIQYQSDFNKDIYFSSLEDAQSYETAVNKYLNSEECKQDFRNAESEFASFSAVSNAINVQHDFVQLLTEPSEELVAACELVQDCTDSNDDVYQSTLNLIFYKLHPELVGKL